MNDKINIYINSKNRDESESASEFNVVIPQGILRLQQDEYFTLNVNGKCIAPSLRLTGDQVVSPHHKGAGPPPPQSEGGGLA